MARATMFFPKDFLWGTATAAHQVEGNNCNNDWWTWEQAGGHILENHRSNLACNWWDNAEADLDRAAEMGTNAHRLSLEWSRIEPSPSSFDDAALDRYRQILQAMHDRGIEPMVTLHHFANPLWLVEKGDFSTDLVVDYFRRYTARVVTTLGDLIPKWITINEPLVYVTMRYLEGVFPAPQQQGWSAAFQALANLLRCHAAAYHTIKAAYPQAQVSVAKHFRPLQAPTGGSALDRWWARRLDGLFNDLWLDSMASGRLRWPLGRGVVKGLAGSFDFVGVNYYSRSFVRFPPRSGRLHENNPDPAAIITDGDFGEIYPAGLYQEMKRVLRYGKPIYITENGLPDTADQWRPSFILTHLREIWRAISFSFPVMGYYHWSLVDNFEWERGWTQRFGLIEMNPETQERRWRPSGRLYSEICHSNGISSDMAERYAPALLATLFPGQAPAPPVAGLPEERSVMIE
jgi:beta-glucosidase